MHINKWLDFMRVVVLSLRPPILAYFLGGLYGAVSLPWCTLSLNYCFGSVGIQSSVFPRFPFRRKGLHLLNFASGVLLIVCQRSTCVALIGLK